MANEKVKADKEVEQETAVEALEKKIKETEIEVKKVVTAKRKNQKPVHYFLPQKKTAAISIRVGKMNDLRIIRFENKTFTILPTDSSYAEVIKLLDAHNSNIANGGSLFRKIESLSDVKGSKSCLLDELLLMDDSALRNMIKSKKDLIGMTRGNLMLQIMEEQK